jgi:nitroreductase
MDFERVVRRRRMARDFESRPIPPEDLDRIVRNGLRGPSAGNSQGYAFLLLEGTTETGRYWDAQLPQSKRSGFAWPGLLKAPVLIVALADEQRYRERYSEPDKRGANPELFETPYWLIDTAFAAMLMLLTATDSGLGALFFSVADIPAFRSSFGVPASLYPIGAIALGYQRPGRGSSSLRRGRRPEADLVHRGCW